MPNDRRESFFTLIYIYWLGFDIEIFYIDFLLIQKCFKNVKIEINMFYFNVILNSLHFLSFLFVSMFYI